jgi:hypothetical protein
MGDFKIGSKDELLCFLTVSAKGAFPHENANFPVTLQLQN